VTVDTALARISVGVVVERAKAQSHWIDFTWKPVAVLVGEPQASPWTLLSNEGDRATFYAGAAEIALYRTETGHYRDNLASAAPALWVALRPTGVDPPFEIFGVTADPAEGEGWAQTDGDIVDVVAMPASVGATIESFVAEHHVERPFHKRKRDRADPDALARRAPLAKERE
jgi:uncharacterized protein DUF3305